MGTNYYVITKMPNDEIEKTHIGKLSMGWSFLFAGHYREIASYDDWLDIIYHSRSYIEDEYGKPMHLIDFKDMVTKSYAPGNLRSIVDRVDEEGYRFCDSEFS